MNNFTHTPKNLKPTMLPLFLLLITQICWAQNISIEGPYYLETGISKHSISPIPNPVSVAPSNTLKTKMSSRSSACSNMTVNFTSAFPAGADTAFEFAMSIWESSIESSIPITISAEFKDLPSNLAATVTPNGYFFVNGVGVADTMYPKPLLEHLTNSEQGSASDPDILITINDADFDFYFGTDANPGPGQVDFVTLILHQIGHGVGFIGFGIVNDQNQGVIRDSENNYPSIFDRFIENGSGTSVLDFDDPSVALAAQLTSDNLFINSSAATAANSGTKPKTYNPATYSFFESYNHLDSSMFPAENINSLMTETQALGQANHNPGPVTLGFLEDMGWNLCEALSIEEASLQTFSILENPVSNQLSIQLPNSFTEGDVTITLYNIAGQHVKHIQQEPSGSLITITGLNNLTSGLYFVQLETSTGAKATKKFIKN